MPKKNICWVMLTLLLASFSLSTFNLQPLKAEPTTIVVPYDYPTIQKAINNAKDGDTILVHSGTYHEHVVVDKSLSVIAEDQNNTTIDGGGTETVVTIAASNITIRGFTIQHGEIGVRLVNQKEGNKFLENKILFNTYYGIYVDRCGRTVIAGNNVSSNGWRGIFLYGSDPCVLDGNLISSNGIEGVVIYYSSNNTVIGNFVSRNGRCGIYIYSFESTDPIYLSGLSKNNMIANNHVSNNSFGIKIEHVGTDVAPAKNEICDNFVAYNDIGLNIIGSCGNSISHNNFIDNLEQLSIYESLNNTWDDGYYAGGNYWSNHNSIDLYRGPSQNETGSDGIGDISYLTSANLGEEDKYPFMYANGWLTLPEVNIISPSTRTYRSNTFPLALSVNKPVWMSYSLDSQANVTVVKNLILIDLPIGRHSITVYANDTLGNEASSEILFAITFLGDMNLDGTVDIYDVFVVAYLFGCSYGSERWNPDADLDNNAIINILDITIVAKDYGKTI